MLHLEIRGKVGGRIQAWLSPITTLLTSRENFYPATSQQEHFDQPTKKQQQQQQQHQKPSSSPSSLLIVNELNSFTLSNHMGKRKIIALVKFDNSHHWLVPFVLPVGHTSVAWQRLGEAWEERHRNVSFGSTPRAPGCNRQTQHQDYVPLLGLGIPRNLHVWLASWVGGRSNVSYASSTPQIRHRTKIEFCIFAGFHRHSWCFTDKKFRQLRVHTQVPSSSIKFL